MGRLERNPRFRFREKEIARILHCWANDQSVLLTGIRRTGKTEVLREALARYSEQGGLTIYIDVQAEDNLLNFYQRLLALLGAELPTNIHTQIHEAIGRVVGLPTKLADWLRRNFSKVSLPGVGEIALQAPDLRLLRYWQTIAESLGEILARHPVSALPVIGIDELPLMLENLMKAGVSTHELSIMLSSLRQLRGSGLRFIIAGSVSFENLLSLNGISHTVLGGLSRQKVPPFSRAEAESYLRENLTGKPAGTHEVINLTLDTLPDYVPEFLVIAVTHLAVCGSPEECADNLEQEVLPAIRRAFLHQFDERLSKAYTADERNTAERILDQIAGSDVTGSRIDGSRLSGDYHKVLLKLQYDNFIIDAADFKWQFSLNLLRLWWRATRGMP